MNFKNLNLINPLIRAVTEAGYSKPTKIQSDVIPHILTGRDIMGCAKPNSGKTAAYAMPVLQLLKKSSPEHKEIRTLILTPTSDLAVEIEESIKVYSKYLPLSLLSVFGEASLGSQLAALRKRVDILIATPGRLLELINERHIDFSKVEILVLDEADKMLDTGFVNEAKKVLKLLPNRKQTLLFSSTMPKEVRKFADTILNHPVEIMNLVSSPAETAQQVVFLTGKKSKSEVPKEPEWKEKQFHFARYKNALT